MLFSFEECSDDPLSERVSLGSFLDAVQEGGLPVRGWGFGEQVEVVGRQVWEVVGQVLWLQNWFLLFDKAFITPLR
jgi:hypothetical protein